MDIDEIRALRVEPGDTLVVRIKDHISQATAQRFADHIGRMVTTPVKVMILDGGASLDILRRGDLVSGEPQMALPPAPVAG